MWGLNILYVRAISIDRFKKVRQRWITRLVHNLSDGSRLIILHNNPRNWGATSAEKHLENSFTSSSAYLGMPMEKLSSSLTQSQWVRVLGLNLGGRRNMLKIGGDGIESTNPRRKRDIFYDNTKYWEMPFRSNFLPLWMLSFYLLGCFLAILWYYNKKEWIVPPNVLSSLLLKA